MSKRKVLAIKARRCARLLPKAWWETFRDPVFNNGQLLAFLAAVAALWLVLQTASPEDRDMQALQWTVGIQAFAIAILAWAAISLIVAPFRVIREDRKHGGWIGTRRLYHEPLLVSVSVWTPADALSGKRVVFSDAERGAFIRYRIELDPPVTGRASAYLERHLGEMDGIFGMMFGANGLPAKAGGGGSIELLGREAVLRVKLDPQTVGVTARVYMTDFSMGEVVA